MLALTATLMFADAARGVSAGVTPVLTLASSSGAFFATTGLSSPAASADGRVFTYTVTAVGALVHGDAMTLTLAAGAAA